MPRDRLYFLLLNIGHFLDHLFMLVFASVSALALHREWGIGYAELRRNQGTNIERRPICV